MARELFTTALLIKAIDEGKEGTFKGMASVYNIKDNGNDVVQPGAFNEGLATNRKIKMLWQHRQDSPIGIYTKVENRTDGLYVEGEINLKTKKGQEAHELLKQGALDGLSIGYMTNDYEIDTQKQVRIIKSADIYEISLVTFPMNEAARVTGVKSFVEMSPSEVERKLRDSFDLTQSQAREFMAKGWKGSSQCDVDGKKNSQRDAGEEELKQLFKALAV